MIYLGLLIGLFVGFCIGDVRGYRHGVDDRARYYRR